MQTKLLRTSVFRVLAVTSLLVSSSLVGAAPKLAAPSRGDVPPDAAPSPATVAITIVDDPSGGASKGVLDPTTATQLAPLLDLAGVPKLSLSYWLIQEEVAEPVALALEGWVPRLPVPEMPSKALPAPAYQKAATLYLAKIRELKAQREEWEKATVTGFEGFLQRATEARIALEARWLAKMKQLRISDFRRSAVAATICAAAQRDAAAGLRFLVISSDGIDLPGGSRAGRKTPLTAAEVPESVEVIFICPDGKLPAAPLFAQLVARPHTHAARDLTETAGLIVAREQQLRGAQVTNAAR